MTEERIGGISVSVGGSLADLEALLAKAESMVADSAKRVGAAGDRYFNPGGKVGGKSGGGGGAASNEQLTTAITQLTHQLSVTRFGGGRAADPYALSAVGGSGGRSRIDLHDLSTTAQDAVRKAVGEISGAAARPSARPASVQAGEVHITSSKPVSLDLSAFDKGLAEATSGLVAFTAALSGIGSAPSAPGRGTSAKASNSDIERDERVRVGVRKRSSAASKLTTTASDDDLVMPTGLMSEPGDPAAAVAAVYAADKERGLRRKRLRGRDIGTEADPNAVYSYEPDQDAQSEVSRQRKTDMISQHYASRPVGTSAAESGIADALYPGASVMRFRAGARLGQLGTPPGAGGGGSATVAPQRTVPPTDLERAGLVIRRTPLTPEQEAAAAIQREREARRTPAAGAPYTLPVSRAALAGGSAGGGSRYRPKTDEEIEREVSNRMAVREAQTVSAGRTPRTGASTLGGFFLGGGRQRIADENALSAATVKRRDAERGVVAAEDNLRNPRVFSDLRAKREATHDLTVAQHDLATSISEEDKARRKVESYSGLKAGARNLLGATLGGAAFGIGLQAVGVAEQAAMRAATPYFDAMTGWAQKTADLTNSLAEQARQTQGNAKGVTALYTAQTGLADATASSIAPIIAQRVQREAGNKAIVDQIQTLRDAQNLSGQNPNAGLTGGGTGGILGTGMFGTPSTQELFGNYLQSLNDVPSVFSQQHGGSLSTSRYAGMQNAAGVAVAPAADKVFANTAKGMLYLNEQLSKGGDAAARFQMALNKTDPSVAATAALFDAIRAPQMAQGIRELGLMAPGIKSTTDALDALKALNLAGTLTGPSTLAAQQQINAQNLANSATGPNGGTMGSAVQLEMARTLPSVMNAIDRQFQRTVDIQQPAQAALSYFSAPPVAPGTGLPVASASDAALVQSSVEGTAAAQSQLNAYYQQGYTVLRDTYGVSQSLLDSLSSTGQAIQGVQTGMANRDAVQAAAQYNYQLMISKQQMGDISGLAGVNLGYGQTQIGVLERGNLLLGRQSQMLGFGMQQRQINFQVASAGFAAAGTTAEARAANIAEAKLEASYAQKQLDIQKQMFGNQVKIVDLTNLRAAQNMVANLGLMISGHRVSLLDAADAQRISRLSAQQQIVANQINAQMTKVESKAAVLISYWQQLEAAAGKTIAATEVAWVSAAYAIGKAWYTGATGGMLQSAPGSAGGGGGSGAKRNASGFLGTTSGPTSMVVGEAGPETVAILRNPRSVSGGTGGGGVNINIINPSVRNDGDLYAMKRMILDVLNNKAALQGLRGASLP